MQQYKVLPISELEAIYKQKKEESKKIVEKKMELKASLNHTGKEINSTLKELPDSLKKQLGFEGEVNLDEFQLEDYTELSIKLKAISNKLNVAIQEFLKTGNDAMILDVYSKPLDLNFLDVCTDEEETKEPEIKTEEVAIDLDFLGRV